MEPSEHKTSVHRRGATLVAEHMSRHGPLPEMDEARRGQLERVWGVSEFAARSCIRSSGLLGELVKSGDLDRVCTRDYFVSRLHELPDDRDLLFSAIRQLRQREMVRIIWRMVTRAADLEETVADLTSLAEACVEKALGVIHDQAVLRYGMPTGDESGEPQRLIVLGLGKLGGRELNLSSDIDLIFLYDETGYARDADGHPGISNQEFFLRVARRLIAMLSEVDETGFVFRVDMRLRPYGDSSALVLSRTAMELYYESEGRDWERYALIKARVVAGDREKGESFLRWMNPFIYRKYLDYGAIDSLRSMKLLIDREVRNRDLEDDLKLGHGGIREIEFVAQSFQLIWGARDPRMQECGLIPVLSLLAERGDLSVARVDALAAAYRFLRESEHIIQAEHDQQTQMLPSQDESRAGLAMALGFDSWDLYKEALDRHREVVQQCFGMIFKHSPEEPGQTGSDLVWDSIWSESESGALEERLSNQGFGEAARCADLISRLQQAIARDRENQELVERADRLMPTMLKLASRELSPSDTVVRIISIVEQLLGRITYLAFLLENPDALKRLVTLCGMSPWIASEIAKQPVLLYELTDRQVNDRVPDIDHLRSALADKLRGVPDDLEEQMEALRQFKNIHQLRAAVIDLSGELPVMKASDLLSDLATVVLDAVLLIAWDYIVSRHGRPVREDGERCDPDFAIVGYGKLGGIELGYSSDLDVVFIHDGALRGTTDGPRPLENSMFFNRLGQRIVHILNSVTVSGILYEIDLRLRPSGRSGLLVSSLNAFEVYQYREAWTWEHQALVRARYIAGDARVGARFEAIREEILWQVRDRVKLREDILDMRQKMRSLERKEFEGDASHFDLKHAAGAIVDIEFMVQYAILAWGHTFPELTRYTDNFRLLEGLEQHNILRPSDAEALRAAYLAYRAAVHYESLGGVVFTAALEQLAPHRRKVVAIWNQLFELNDNLGV